MKTYWLSILCVSLLWLAGCNDATSPATPETPAQEDATQSQGSTGESDSTAASSEKPTEDSANASEDDIEFFVIDVRSAEEFAGGNVDGSINIPHTEIVEGVKSLTDDKSAKIYFY